MSGKNLKMKFCSSLNGSFDYCAEETPELVSQSDSAMGVEADKHDEESRSGIPGWANALIVVTIVLIIPLYAAVFSAQSSR